MKSHLGLSHSTRKPHLGIFLSALVALCSVVESRAVPRTENAPAAAKVDAASRPTFQFHEESGVLTISSPAGTQVRGAQDAGGFLILNTEGWEVSGNPASPNFQPALQGVSASTLHLLRMEGGSRLTVGDLTTDGALAIEANQLTLTGRLHAPTLRISAAQHLEIDAAAHLSAQSGANGGSIFGEAPIIITGGVIDASGERGGSIRFAATNLFQYGRLQADGDSEAGTIAIAFDGKYRETEAARVLARSKNGLGGSIAFNGAADATFFSSGTVEATGREGGTVHVLGGSLKLAAARIDASGTYAGGSVLVGGDKQGANATLRNARHVSLNPATQLFADAHVSGPGGKIVVWSDGRTEASGKYSARGGMKGGDGGFIEASGKGELAYGAQADAAAPQGKPGTLLLDPKFIEVKNAVGGGGQIGFSELVDPHPTAGSNFGIRVLPLSTGNVVVTDPGDDTNGISSGAIYLFNGKTGALISTLVGAAAGDALGGVDSGFGFYTGADIIDVGANAYVISQDFNNKRGALTYINGTTGVSGTASATNSILAITQHTGGFDPGEFPATSFAGPMPFAAKLSTGNYVLVAAGFNSRRGFAMFLDGATGLPPGAAGVAQPSAANTLIGTNTNDQVGVTLTDLKNGHYLIFSTNPSTAAANANRGALTFCDSTAGTVGAVSPANSVVGTNNLDSFGGQVVILPNNNFLVLCSNFAGGQGGNPRGSVTLISGTTGRPVVGTQDGTIDATNTYLGAANGDRIASSNFGGAGVTVAANGNYAIASPSWGTNRGAVAVGNQTTGVVGVASATNSLVGHTSGNGSSTFGDSVGSGANISSGTVAVGDGNFAVVSPSFNGFRGAVTWIDGDAPLVGDVISSANSLVGTTGVTPGQPDNSLISDRVGIGGVYSSQTNSFFNGQSVQSITYNITNGNYVVLSPVWGGGGDGGFSFSGKGAATWGSGNTGVTGEINAANSLVGATAAPGQGDGIGNGIVVLANGNYVVRSRNFNETRGAWTWGNGTAGITGVVSSSNSLVGSTQFVSIADNSGNNAVALTNGNYVIGIPNHTANGNNSVGAIVWGDGSTNGTPLVGSIDAVNKITGSNASDNVGQSVKALPNGNAFAVSQNFNSGGVQQAGAVTWINGTNGRDVTGGFNPVSATNSLVGGSPNDAVGSGYQGGYVLPSGNYLISSPGWDNGGATNAGAVTFCKGDGTTVGVVGPANSLVGDHQNDGIGNNFTVIVLPNGNYVVGQNSWNGFAGAVTWGSGTTGVKGVVGPANSVLGFSDSGAGIQDQVGSFQIASPGNGNPLNNNPKILANGDFVVITPNWHNGSNTAGAGTFISGTTGQTITGFGLISASNSVVGQGTFGSTSFGIEDVPNGNFYVAFNNEDGGKVRTLTGTGQPAPLYGVDPSASIAITPATITNALGAGTNVVLQANTDVTFTDPVVVTGNGAGKLTVQAGRSILINANITSNNGIVELIANDVLAAGVVNGQRDAGAGVITMATGTTIDTGTAALTAQVRDGAGKTNSTSGFMTLRAIKSNGGSVTNSGLTLGSNIYIESLETSGDFTTAAISVALGQVDVGDNKLTVNGNLNLAEGSLTTQIGGTGAGQFGQVVVNGVVDLGTSPDGAVLNATLVGGYVPQIGDAIPIIDNDQTDLITGTFFNQPENSAINVSGTSFRVRYTGGTSNDATLTIVPGPEIAVEQNGSDLMDGVSQVDFGAASAGGGSSDLIFTIKNTGGADLNLPGTPKVSVGGMNAADFSVTATPSSPVASNGSTTFTVKFTPSALNLRTATISIENDDADEAPFDFTVFGSGVDATAPNTTITNGPPPMTNNPDVTITFTGTDNFTAPAALTFTGQLNGGGFNPVVSPLSLTGLGDGTYTFEVQAKDEAGNVDPTPATITFEVDTSAPPLSGTFSPLIFVAGTPLPDYAGQATRENGVTVTQSPAIGSATVAGILKVTLTATDAAQNSSTLDIFVDVRPTAPVNSSLIAKGAPAPGAGTAGGPPTGATVTSFGPPAVDVAGNVAFTAKYTGSAGVGTGLFTDTACLGIVGGDVPGIAGAKFKSFSDPVITGGRVASVITMTGVPAASAAAVFTATTSTDGAVVARAGEVAAADGAKFKSFKSVDVDGTTLAFAATLAVGSGVPKATKATDAGVWLVEIGSAPVPVYRESQMVGAQKIKSISSFDSSAGSRGQGRGWLQFVGGVATVQARVAYFDKTQAALSAEVIAGNVFIEPLLQTGDIVPPVIFITGGIGLPAVNGSGQAALLASSDSSTGAKPGVYARFAGTNFTRYAAVGTTTPDIAATFKTLQDPVLADDGGLAFPAKVKGATVKGAAGNTLWWLPPGDSLTLLAQGGAKLGGVSNDLPTGVQWNGFTSLGIAAGRGPVFSATLVANKGGVAKANGSGVWAMDFTGKLRTLFRLGDMVGGKKVTAFNILTPTVGNAGVTRSFNDTALVVWLATFNDKSQAIVTTEVP